MKKFLLIIAAMLLVSGTVFAQQTKSINPEGTLHAVYGVQLDEPITRAPGDVVYTQGFETTTGTALPTGWIVNHTGTADSWITVGNGTDNIPGVTGNVPTHTGDRMLALSWNQTGRNAWAISSGITLTGGTIYEVTFWLSMPGYQGVEYSGLECLIGNTNTPAGLAAGTTIYYNNCTKFVTGWTKITGYFQPSATGSYYLGFHDLSAAGTGIYTIIDDIEIVEANPASVIFNDLKITADNPILTCTKVPASQMGGLLVAGGMTFPKTLTAEVSNVGFQAQTGVTFSATLNGANVGTTATLPSLAPNASAKMTLNTQNMHYPNAAGNHNLVFSVSQNETEQNPADNTTTFTLEVGNKYQLDAITDYNLTGVGSNSGALTLGNVFTIYNATQITEVELGFLNNPALAGTGITVSLFPMTSATNAGAHLFTVNATRPAGGTLTVPVTPTNLNAGTSYFLAVNQLTANNIGVCYDTRPGSNRAYSKTYSATGAAGALTMQGGFGALAIRMVTSGGTPQSVVFVDACANNANYGDVTGAGAYWPNSPVTLTAKAKYGHEFVQWSDGITANPYPTFNATTDFAIMAIFQEKNTCVEKIVGTGTSTVNYSPINTFWGYTYSQQIYSAADIGKTGEIKSIALEYIHATLPYNATNVTIYMGVTNKNTFTNAQDLIPISELQQVYSGPATLSNASQWSKITLNTPFPYTCGNLVVAFVNNQGANIGSGASFRVSTPTPSGNYAISYYQDSGAINPAAPTASNMNVYTIRANMKFEVCEVVACADKQIGNGTTTQRIYPIDHFYNHSYVQEIFLASEIGVPAGAITSLSFQHGNFAGITKINQTVYLANITKSAFGTTASASEWIPGAQLTKVWGGTITMAQNSWVTITFDEPFEYAGGNLVVAFLNLAGSFGTSDARYLTHATPDRKTFYWSADGAFSGILTPPSSGTNYATVAFRNNIIFNLCGEQPMVEMAAISITGPQSVINLDQATYTVTVKNNAAVAANSYTVNVLDAANTLLGSTQVTTPLAPGATATVNVSFVFPTSLAGSNHNIKGQVVIGCDANLANNETPMLLVGVIDYCVDLDKITKGTQIGNGTTTSTTHPFAFYYRGGATQTIYSAADLNVPAGTVITGLSFRYAATTALTNSPQIKVYLANTTQSNFASTTSWLSPNQFIQVYHNTVNIPTGAYELQLTFDVPFIYTGGTLCVMTEKVLDLVLAYTNNVLSQQTASTPTNRVLYYQNDSAPWAPSVTGTLSSNVPNAIFHFAKDYKELSVDYEIIGEGEVNVVLGPTPPVCGGTLTVTITPANDCTAINAIKFNGVTQPLQTSYTFPDQNVPLPFITIETFVPHFNILATANGNGVIIPDGLIDFTCGDDQTFDFLPDMGYMVDYVVVDGTVLPKSMYDYYTFTNIIAPHTIHVEFKEAPLTIYFSHESADGGKVIPVGKELQIPYGQIGVDYGDMQQFLFIPQTNYVLQAVYIDGVYNALATNTGSYFFFNIQANHVVHAVFAPVNFNIFASAGTGGWIDPAGNNSVPYGSDKTFTFGANTGYVIDKLYVDNVEVPVATSYTFENVEANHTIYVTFKIAELVIHMNWNQGGTLYPTGNTYIPTGTYSGDVYVSYNSTQEITFTPQTGYKVTSLVVNGVSYPNYIPTGSYTFYYIKTDQTITVTFAKIQYEIIAKADQHSVITPAGTTLVPHGNNMKYDFYALNGYHLTSVFIDGIDNKPAVAAGTYTFENVTKAHTIDVVTAINTYTISAKVTGNGGYITPAGDTKVNWGGNQLYTITTYPGYKITAVLVDGVANAEAAATGKYAFLNVKEDHTIEVSFELLRFSIVSTASENGLIDPMGITETDYGTDVTFTITPYEGYKVSFVLVNGTNVGEITSYTFTNVEGDGTIDAFFEKVTTDPDDPDDPNSIKDPLAEVSVYNQTNIVYIVNKKQVPLQDVSIFDMYGRVVWQGNVYNNINTITLNVANGIYAVRIATGEQYSTTKISIVR